MHKPSGWLYASTVLWGRRALAFGGAAALAAYPAHANPLGGTVSAGTATISGQGTPVVQVNQNSDRAVIDWKSFNIAPGEATRFAQPSSTSAILNRIHDQNPSQILGNISANGQVMLVNPNGMLFGKGSRVDVSGLVATSASISSQSFMSSTPFRFGQPGLPDSAIINQGTISVQEGGLAALVAPEVRNDGLIKAKAGKVVLASGDTMTLDLYGDQLVSVAASDKLKAQRIDQAGRIEAAGGEVILTTADAAKVIDRVINMDGWVDVGSLTEEAGSIILHAAGGDANVRGQLHADSGSMQGGRLQVTGENVRVSAGSLLTATGKTGGGNIKIGGDYLGGGTTPHARTTVIEQSAEIKANATGKGAGGRVIVWSDERTDFAGLIQAKGGLLGGDGGFIETSSKEILIAHGLADASAPKGKGGEWLLDPNNITINTTADANVAGAPNFVTTNDSAVVTVASILASLNAGTNVSVTTGTAGGNSQAGNITVSSAIGKTAGGEATLTLKAHNNISVNSNISSTSNKLNVTLWSDLDNSGAGRISVSNAAITSNGGNVILGGGTDPTADEAVGTTDAGVNLSNGDISAGAGNISIRGRGEATGSDNYGIFVQGGTLLQTTSGNITLNGIGGNGTENNFGVRFDQGDITAGSGNISVTGVGGNGTGDENFGIGIEDSSDIATTSGNITLDGTGGSTGTDYNRGISDNCCGNTITSVDGDILLIGQGGDGSGERHGGIHSSSTTITTTGTGAGAGNITLDGTGGDGTLYGFGVELAGSTIQTADGDIEIDGTAGTGNGWFQVGVMAGGGGDIIATGDGAIDITGIGGDNGSQYNYGINFADAGTTISAVSGGITLDGTGGAGSSDSNFGIVLDNGADILTTGTGAAVGGIILHGTGGEGTTSNHGIYLNAAGTTITAVDGDIELTGIAGGDGSGSTNQGIRTIGVTIQSTGTGANAGNITLDGTGGDGSTQNRGISLRDTTLVTAVDGDIAIIGDGGTAATTSNNQGIQIFNSSSVTTTGAGAGAGNITITGTGGVGTASNHGILLDTSVAITVAGPGTVSLTGSSNATGTDFITQNGANVIGGAAGDDVTLTADEMSFSALTVTSDEDVILKPRTAGTSMGISGGAGDLQITDAMIAMMNPGETLVIGNSAAGTGAIDISAWDISGETFNVGVYGGTVDFTGGFTYNGANNLTFHSRTGNLAWDQAITKSAGGDSFLLMRAAGNITMTQNFAPVAGAVDVTLWADGDNSGAGGITLTNAAITSNGGNVILGGGTDPSADEAVGTTASGVELNNGDINVGAGNISIRGRGEAAGSDNHGIYVRNGSLLQSTSGNITLTGIGGNGTNDNPGIRLIDAGTTISTADGDILLTGTGGAGSSDDNGGVQLWSNSLIESTGTGAGAGTITLIGAGKGVGFGAGVELDDSDIASVDGDITLTGTSTDTGFAGIGFRFINNATITSTGTGANAADINITGTGSSNAGLANAGAYMDATGSSISTVDGDITLSGTAGGNGGNINNMGIWMFNGVEIASTGAGAGAGNITLTGVGGTGTSGSHGIYLDTDAAVTAAGSGTITFTGTSNATGTDLLTVNGANVIGGAAAGDVTLIGNTMDFANLTVTSAADIYVRQRTAAGTTIGLGGGAGTLNLTDAELAFFNAGSELILGRADGTGAMIVDAYNAWNSPVIFRVDPTGSITVSGAAFTFSGPVALNAGVSTSGATGGTGAILFGDDVTLGADVTVNGGTGGTITFSDIVNGAQDLTLSAGGAITLNGVVGGVTPLDDLTITTNANPAINANVSGGGILTLDTLSAGTTMGLGGAAGTVNYAAAELGRFGSGWTLINIGNTAQTGATTVGAGTPLDDLTITSDADPTIGSSMDGTGILTLQQASNATTMGVAGGAGALNYSLADLAALGSNWTSMRFGSTTATGTLTVGANAWDIPVDYRAAAAGSIVIAGAQTTVAASGTTFTFSGPTSLGANVSTAAATGGTQDITFNDDVTLTANAQVLAGNGDLAFAGTIDGAFDLTLNAAGTITLSDDIGAGTPLDDLTITSDADPAIGGTMEGTGILTLQQASNATTMGVAGGAGALNYSAADLAGLGANWTSLRLGSPTATGTLTVGARAWDIPVDYRAAAAGSIVISGAQTAGAASDTIFTFSGPATINAPLDLTNATGGTQAITFNDAATVNADITSGGGDIAFNDTLSLNADIATGGGDMTLADDVTLTGTSSIDTDTADIGFDGTLNGTFDLTLSTTGDVDFSDDVGMGAALDDLAIAGAADVTFAGGLHAVSVTLTGGTGAVLLSGVSDVTNDIDLTTTGTVTFDDALAFGGDMTIDAGASAIAFNSTVDGPGNADLSTTHNITFGDDVGASAALSDIVIADAADVTFSGTLDADSFTLTSGTGAVLVTGAADLSGDIDLTTTGAVTFGDALTFGGGMAADSGASDIMFTGTVDGPGDMELTTTNDVLFMGDVGGVTRLGDVTIDPRHFTAGAFNAASFTFTNGTGNVAFSGTGLNTTGDIGIDTNGNVTGTYTGANGLFDSGAGTITATVSFTGLDIAGAGATLSAGYIGAPGAADQTMANLISIDGLRNPWPMGIPNPAYTLGFFAQSDERV